MIQIRASRWFGGKAGAGAIIIAAALLVELLSALQYFYMRDLLNDEIEHNAEADLRTKAVVTRSMLNHFELLQKNYRDEIAEATEHPSDIYKISRSIVEKNPYVIGAGVAFVPGYYKGEGERFEPWAFNDKDSIKTGQMASELHDYTTRDFFRKSIKERHMIWSEPYLDTVGAKDYIITLATPVWDDDERLAGVFGFDISLQWLGDTINAHSRMPSSFCVILTEDGKLIALPHHTHPKARDFKLIEQTLGDSTVDRRLSANKRIEIISFKSPDGDKGYIFFGNIRGKPHWIIALVSYEDELYAPLNKPRRNMLIAMLIGFSLIGLILLAYSRSRKMLFKAQVEQQRLDTELDTAQKIQHEMLPTAVIDHDNLEVASTLLPARQVGGDLYDFRLRDEKLFFCIADVSGKGVAAALIMAITHAHFRAATLRELRPARIAGHINTELCTGNETNMFVTFFVGVLDLPTGRLRYCNAGHDAPLLLRGEASVMPVEANLPLGVIADFDYKEQEMKLEPDDTLLLYTDGVTEAMNSSHAQFSLERLLQASHTRNPQQLIDTIIDRVKEFIGDAEQSDDITMLALHYTPKVEKTTLERSLTITNDLNNVPLMNGFIKEVGQELKLNRSAIGNLQLALEEVVVNVINYAYPQGTTGDIRIDAIATAADLRLVVTDSGKPFAPTTNPDVDTTLSAEERQIGGLGIFLVRQLMDSINYERVNGQNVLTLRKTINKQQ